MSVFELLGIMGLAMVAAYVVAWSTQLDWYRRPLQIGRNRLPILKLNGFKSTYVSETTPAYFQYVRRRHRYAVECPAQYHVDGQVGEGVVVDMTREGWRIKGPGGVRLGVVLIIDVTLPGTGETISISRAVVCWVRGAEFGIKLETMDLLSAAKLSAFVSSLPQVAVCGAKAA